MKTPTTILLALCAGAAVAAPPRYSITELTPSDPEGSSWGRAIHDDGRVAGARTRNRTQTVGTVWTSTALDYGPFDDNNHAWATALGSNQTVFGAGRRAFLFASPITVWASNPDLAPTLLPFLPSGQYNFPMGANNANQVAGWLSQIEQVGQQSVRRAYTVLVDGVLRDPVLIPTLGGWSNWGNSINSTNRVVGGSLTALGPIRAFEWTGGAPRQLGTLGGPASEAIDVNDAGRIVGWSTDANGARRAFLYQAGVMIDLGTLGGAHAEARAISNTGVIVGQSWTSDGGAHAFVHGTTHPAAMYDLQRLTPAASQGWMLSMAEDINASGSIVGWGTRLIDGKRYTRGFRLDPVCPADLNGNGAVDFFDYLDFVAAFSSEDPLADFNHNDTVDFFDYLDFVEAFSQSCG
jgi:probable HAF family extracellular repeat protein